MKIAFIHPDLGIGGAERLIVDAAYGLQKEGHKVTIFTSHCDKSHCFEEVKNDELDVKVYGDFLPTQFLNSFKIVFAILRQFVLLVQLVVNGEISEYDYFIVDQLSFCLPLLHLFHDKRARILFYCHFPDQKLAKHDGIIRTLYRLPFDLYEQFSTGAADSIVVNSEFTKTVYDETFGLIKEFRVPDVIYPSVDLTKEIITEETKAVFDGLIGDSRYFLSINRFEKKKNIELAINSFKLFRKSNPSSTVKLVITGGFDSQVEENTAYLQHLEKLTFDSDIKALTVFNDQYSKYTDETNEYDVLFLPSVSSNLKELLLSNSSLLLYTPSFEHFGIVPLEAMKFGVPVLAVNNGGPTESIISLDENPLSGTGWLEPSDAKLWSLKLAESLKLSRDLISKNGSKQLNLHFSREKMTEGFERNMLQTLKLPHQAYTWEKFIHLWKVPVFLYIQSNFETLYAYAIILFLFFPPSIFQLIGIGGVTVLYIIEPSWFVKWW